MLHSRWSSDPELIFPEEREGYIDYVSLLAALYAELGCIEDNFDIFHKLLVRSKFWFIKMVTKEIRTFSMCRNIVDTGLIRFVRLSRQTHILDMHIFLEAHKFYLCVSSKRHIMSFFCFLFPTFWISDGNFFFYKIINFVVRL